MDMNDFSQIFFTEAEELLTEMEQLLLQLDIEAPDQGATERHLSCGTLAERGRGNLWLYRITGDDPPAGEPP